MGKCKDYAHFRKLETKLLLSLLLLLQFKYHDIQQNMLIKNNISDNISVNLFALPLETSVCEVIGGDSESKGEVQGKGDGKDETCHSHGGVTPKNEGERGGTGVAHVTVETNQLSTLVVHRVTTSHVGVICLLVLAYSMHLLSRTLN
jgi:hypothetical protein